MGEAIFLFFGALLAVDAAAFLVLLASVFIEAAAEILQVNWLDICAAVVVVLILAFLGWFAVGMPWPGEDYPQPILERRFDE